MTTRRRFLGGLLASGLVPTPSWADVGAPRFLSAARMPSGSFVLVGLQDDLSEAFRLPLPTRGHAAAAHPVRPEAVAFARRPGTYAIIVDCHTGDVLARLDAPVGRHFYGHGCYSGEGHLLFTTENDYDNASGVIGVWDVRDGYRRVGEFFSGGVGPHEIALMPGAEMLVVANGGIETHPESGRVKLNIPMMRPNLCYCGFDGQVLDIAEPPLEMHRNSIRHLAVSGEGTVVFGMQWQGDRQEVVPLVGAHKRGSEMRFFAVETEVWRQMKGYVGSVAISPDGSQAAVTSPRGGVAAVFDVAAAKVMSVRPMEDVCGAAFAARDFVFTTGNGVARFLDQGGQATSDLAFDNHLLRL
ncbi:DUF1513 domain-containing protein [Shimia sediminis]|uniref:DUF1513 domain-containing protein n=1 Tax=Shimia sediminis TaxID=2497945 RepID=UPI000F8CDABD|nr:DUF1513 domain-containing protein [Shimia sediminis]